MKSSILSIVFLKKVDFFDIINWVIIVDVTNIKGVGPKMALSLKKMNINTTDELIHYYPYRYNYYEIKNLSKDLEESSGCINVYKAKVLKAPVVNYIKKNFNRMSFSFSIM